MLQGRQKEEAYLGSSITTTGGTEEDAEIRCSKAQVFFCILRPAWRYKCISPRAKPRIFNLNVNSLLLYGPKRTSSPNFRSLSMASFGTSWEGGGQRTSRRRTLGSVPIKIQHPEKKMESDWPTLEEAYYHHHSPVL